MRPQPRQAGDDGGGNQVDPRVGHGEVQRVRKDWPVVEIKDANHFDCILKPQFKDEISAWLRIVQVRVPRR